MEDISADIRRTREDHYFLKQEQQRLEEMRRKSAREAEISRLMEAFGIREQELVRELADAGFDIETFRLLYLVPLVQVAWSDGGVSPRESDQVLGIAGLHGIKAGSAAHERLVAWLTERPSDQFFQACLRGHKSHAPAPAYFRGAGSAVVTWSGIALGSRLLLADSSDWGRGSLGKKN